MRFGLQKLRFKTHTLMLVIIAFGALGAYLLLHSQASSVPAVGFEAEQGTVNNARIATSDTTASGNSFVTLQSGTSQTPPKKLLLFQQQLPTADYVASHIDEVDALPYEGILFILPSTDMMRGTSIISTSQFKSELAGMKIAQTKLKKVRSNFVYVRLIKTGPFSTQTPIAAANFANLAEAAADAGLAGIAYDNEDYEDDTWDPAITCPGDTIETCQTKAVAAGKTVMQAAIARWPTMTLMSMLGPFFADMSTFQAILHEAPLPKHLILGAYTIGFNEATIGTNATYVDGAEVFSIHTQDVAQADYALRKSTMPQASSLISSDIKTAWSQKLSLGFSLYDEQGGTADRWQNDIAVNAKAADEYTWAFSFYHIWLGEVPQGRFAATPDWIQAVVNGRTAAGLSPMPQ